MHLVQPPVPHLDDSFFTPTTWFKHRCPVERWDRASVTFRYTELCSPLTTMQNPVVKCVWRMDDRTIDVHHELPVNLPPPADISSPVITHANMHHLCFSCNLPTGSSWGCVCCIWLSLSTIKRDSCSSDTVGSLIREVREGQLSVRYGQLLTDRGGKYDIEGVNQDDESKSEWWIRPFPYCAAVRSLGVVSQFEQYIYI